MYRNRVENIKYVGGQKFLLQLLPVPKVLHFLGVFRLFVALALKKAVKRKIDPYSVYRP